MFICDFNCLPFFQMASWIALTASVAPTPLVRTVSCASIWQTQRRSSCGSLHPPSPHLSSKGSSSSSKEKKVFRATSREIPSTKSKKNSKISRKFQTIPNLLATSWQTLYSNPFQLFGLRRKCDAIKKRLLLSQSFYLEMVCIHRLSTLSTSKISYSNIEFRFVSLFSFQCLLFFSSFYSPFLCSAVSPSLSQFPSLSIPE